LIGADESLGLVLTCSHLFDQSTGRIVVTFPNGSRFAARLIDRDRAHDLAALSIRRPGIDPIKVSTEPPHGLLTACGFGPNAQFRCIRGAVTGEALPAGAAHPSLTMAGAVRPGDSGGSVLDERGQLVGVVWGQRDCQTYATCGRPVHEFVHRICGKQFAARPLSPATSPQPDWKAWSSRIESQLQALEAKKQDKGPYLKADDLSGFARIADIPRIDANQFAKPVDLDQKFTVLTARLQAVQQRLQDFADSETGVFQGLSLGKLLVGALGLSGPVAAAVIVAAGLAARRAKKRLSADRKIDSKEGSRTFDNRPSPIAVDTPPPPQRTVPETHYVPIEKDSFAKAHQWASEHVARKYPGASEILQAQDSLIKQYLAAK
jgi:hypothetical protein